MSSWQLAVRCTFYCIMYVVYKGGGVPRKAMHEIHIRANDAGQRLDKFLAKVLRDIPPALMYKAIRTKKIKVNRRRAEGKQMLLEGDTVQLFLPDEFFGGKGDAGHDLARITPRLSILYEDENILLLNKRPGVLVHEDAEERGEILIEKPVSIAINKLADENR